MPNSSTTNICAQLVQAIKRLKARSAALRKAHPGGISPELQDVIDELADAENAFRTKCGPPPQLKFLPKNLDFGIVMPGTTGPSLAVDPSIPPPAVSFQGGIEIDSTPADATVSASITGDTAHFQVRDIIVIDTVVDEGGNVSREVVAQANGGVAVGVRQRQLLLVRVQFAALDSEGAFHGTCVIQSNAWETIRVPLSIALGGVKTTFPSPLIVTQGKDSEVQVVVHSLGGPEVSVTYGISPTQLHTGLAIVSAPITVKPHEAKAAKVIFRVDPEAPLGIQVVGIDQFAPQHTSELVQVKVVLGNVVAGLSQPAQLHLRPGQAGTISVDITAEGGAIAVLLESGSAPSGFTLRSADRDVPAKSTRTVALEFSVDRSAPRVTDSPLTIKWTADDGVHSGSLTMTVSIKPETKLFTSGNLGPSTVTGSASLAMNSDGYFQFTGQIRENGLVGHKYCFAMATDVEGLGWANPGKIGGTTDLFTHRDDAWTQQNFDQRIVDNWDKLKVSQIQSTLHVNTAVFQVLEGIVEAALAELAIRLVIAGIVLLVTNPEVSVAIVPIFENGGAGADLIVTVPIH